MSGKDHCQFSLISKSARITGEKVMIIKREEAQVDVSHQRAACISHDRGTHTQACDFLDHEA